MIKGSIIAAKQPDDSTIKKISSVFGQIYGTEVVFELKPDPSLLGGICVEIDGTLYDGSLRGKLGKIVKIMKSEGP
ncbi:MAG: F0F1 ATP synthase subunit delta [Eubacteriales bacterium]|nr:F0F1 ATP synthase subunit delta [Eubacteriales bacterium]